MTKPLYFPYYFPYVVSKEIKFSLFFLCFPYVVSKGAFLDFPSFLNHVGFEMLGHLNSMFSYSCVSKSFIPKGYKGWSWLVLITPIIMKYKTRFGLVFSSTSHFHC